MSSPIPVSARAEQEARNGHKAAVVWLTGLPGSGKTTLAFAVCTALQESGMQAVVLDGDKLRDGLCADLGFSVQDRLENMRRVGEVAKLFMMQGTVALVALVSPVRSARDRISASLSDGDFYEVYCSSPLEVCKARDPKGMYAKAEKGLIADFTGVSAPYEAPLAPALTVNTGSEPVHTSVQGLLAFLRPRLALLPRGAIHIENN
jgi:adenylylsulfate kinase